MKAGSGTTFAARTNECFKHGFVWLILLFSFFPLYVVLAISFKSSRQFFNQPWTLTFPFQLENWQRAWGEVAGTILNSLYLAVTSTFLTLTVAVLAAYFFARFRVVGRDILWAAFLALMLMPDVVNLIPLFSLLRTLDLLNSLNALVLLFAAGGQTICIFLLRGFIEDIPKDLFDAAQMDGAGHLRQIIHVVLPMSGAILATLAILRFVASWNSFIPPLVFLRDEAKFPVGVRLYQLEGAYLKEWGPLMATYALAAIPLIILFIFGMQYFVRGVGAGAIKG